MKGWGYFRNAWSIEPVGLVEELRDDTYRSVLVTVPMGIASLHPSYEALLLEEEAVGRS
jgi:hypothetical protein